MKKTLVDDYKLVHQVMIVKEIYDTDFWVIVPPENDDSTVLEKRHGDVVFVIDTDRNPWTYGIIAGEAQGRICLHPETQDFALNWFRLSGQVDKLAEANEITKRAAGLDRGND